MTAAPSSVPGAEPLLAVRGLTAHYHEPATGRLEPALSGVDLEVRAGECLGITGESGGGKSTLARALAGLARGEPGVTGGEFFHAGRRILRDFPHPQHPLESSWRGFLFRHWQRTYQRRLGGLAGRETFFLSQDPRAALNPYLTVAQQLVECLPRGGGKGERERRVAELLAQVALEPRVAGQYPHEISTGMCQRAAVAMALALPCRVVLADEPVTKLDPRIRVRVVELLARLPASGRALVLFTHQLDLIQHLASRVAVLFRGRIVEEGPAEVVLGGGHAHHPYTELLVRAAGGAPTWETAALSAPLPDTGCPYRLRCPLPKEERCAAEVPPLAPLGEGHRGRCWVRAAP